ncbi:hypothetical protein FZ983_05125 [Azospirillum sp. B21]|nr:hypothetical protein FZ983_05125 [Azospirillum sp. B21]
MGGAQKSPSPPRGEGRGEGDALRAQPENPRRASPLTLTLSPGGRGNTPHSVPSCIRRGPS